MFAAAEPHKRLKFDDYLRFEESSDVKHEFVAGEIFAFAGASVRHNDIVVNIMEHLLSAVRQRGCRLNVGDVLLKVSDDTAYYPDLMVVCDSSGVENLYVTTPCLIVEVLSPSTESSDGREKLKMYQEIPSMQSYLIVYQDERRVVHHWREADDWWNLEIVGDGIIPIANLDYEISLNQIYARID